MRVRKDDKNQQPPLPHQFLHFQPLPVVPFSDYLLSTFFLTLEILSLDHIYHHNLNVSLESRGCRDVLRRTFWTI